MALRRLGLPKFAQFAHLLPVTQRAENQGGFMCPVPLIVRPALQQPKLAGYAEYQRHILSI